MAEFIAMDGYWMYVWPSFGLTLVALIWMIAAPWLRLRRLLR
ncbi:MAG: heme exporter protein CcmD [Gammaproteobacteria bacterium]